jgi:hypothetical protein
MGDGQLFRGGLQFRFRHCLQHPRIRLARSQALQGAAATDAQQIGQTDGQLDAPVLQQSFHLAVQAHPVTRQLVLPARERTPQPLFGVRHKTENRFPGHMPARQPFGIPEIVFTSFARTIGVTCGQVQLAPPFQLPPHRLPVLRGRFHNRFAHLLCRQPFRLLSEVAAQSP